MKYKRLGTTDMTVSTVSFGAWAIGGFWGEVDDGVSMRALHAAIDSGVNFLDTADVYGDGRSERLIAQLKKERPRETIWVATKAGRRLPQQTREGFTREHLTLWVDRSLENLDVDAIDLLQLHCPHPAVYDAPEVFDILDDLVTARQAPLLRRQRGDGRRGDARHPSSSRADRADHFQHVPAQAGRHILRGRAGAMRWSPRTGSVGKRPVDWEVPRRLDIRRRRPPPVQPKR